MYLVDNAYGLVVGIANYQYINRLPLTVVKDARDVHELLTDAHHCGYLPGNVNLLLDDQATQSTIRQALADLAARSDEGSTVFLYVSSHGGRIESGPHAGEYLLPVDTVYTSDKSVAQTTISGAEFTEALRAIPARKAVVMFDCCHAGGIGQPKDAAAPQIKAGLPESYYDKLKAGRGRVILASSRSTEVSWILPGAENSLFTQHLLAGLRGGIASDDGVVRIFDLFEYVQPKVTVDQPGQHPIFKAEIEENFPVALYLGGQKGFIDKDEQGYRYDVYVSYAEDNDQDREWVWETLWPRLEQAGLRVAVSDYVAELGVSLVANIERGITQARRTVLVLSPHYVESRAAHFESIMAQNLAVEERAARMIPVIVQPFDLDLLPYRLSPNIVRPADLSKPGRSAALQFEKLVQTLEGPVASLF